MRRRKSLDGPGVFLCQDSGSQFWQNASVSSMVVFYHPNMDAPPSTETAEVHLTLKVCSSVTMATRELGVC